MDPQLLQYIHNQARQGIPQEEITQMLRDRGWPLEVIDQAFKYLAVHPEQINTINAAPSIHLRGPLQLANDTLQYLKSRIIPVIVVSYVPMIITFIVTLAFVIAVLATTFSKLIARHEYFSGFSSSFTGEFLPLIVIAIFGGVLIASFSVAWGQASLYSLIATKDRKLGIIDSFKIGLSHTLPFWLIIVISFVFIVGGLSLFIVPGVLFFVWLAFAPYIIVQENTSAFKAILKSIEYVRGKWWAVFGRILAAIGFLILGSILITICSRLFRIESISVIFSFLYTALSTPFLIVYILLIFDDLKSQKGIVEPRATTLVKTLMILVSLGLLFFIGLTTLTFYSVFNRQQQVSFDMKKLNGTQQIRDALEKYYTNNQHYPSTLNELIPEYFTTLPIDPDTNQPYQYTQDENGQEYSLCTHLKKLKPLKDGCYHAIDAKYLYNYSHSPSPTRVPTLDLSQFPSPTPIPPDNIRVSDLYVLQNVLAQWKADRGGVLPNTLEDAIQYMNSIPKDPVTNSPYPYSKKSDGTDYELCATFDTFTENNSHTICFSSQKRADTLLTGSSAR